MITGHKRELVQQAILDGAAQFNYQTDRVKYAYQEKQLGTGDAVKSALPALADFIGTIIILPGDAPGAQLLPIEAPVQHSLASLRDY